jgi:transcriptional regulator with XRE-family HTH domain
VSSLQQAFQKKLRMLRAAKNLTQWDAAALCGMSENYYQRLESSQDPNPTLKILEDIAAGFGISVLELLQSETLIS